VSPQKENSVSMNDDRSRGQVGGRLLRFPRQRLKLQRHDSINDHGMSLTLVHAELS